VFVRERNSIEHRIAAAVVVVVVVGVVLVVEAAERVVAGLAEGNRPVAVQCRTIRVGDGAGDEHISSIRDKAQGKDQSWDRSPARAVEIPTRFRMHGHCRAREMQVNGLAGLDDESLVSNLIGVIAGRIYVTTQVVLADWKLGSLAV
jgi:hypothetical protein